MTKKDLVRAIAKDTGFTMKDIKAVLESMQKVTFATLPGEKVQLMDGVAVEAVYKEARECRNPATGEKTAVPAKYVPHIKFGKAIKDAVNA